jgi:tripartite-type tricarboxylate transporter receptor subunit TctC
MTTIGVAVLACGTVCGQSYPDRPVRIVCSQIGGINDFLARFIAHGISGSLGQPVIIENRATLVTTEIVAKATPDGYTALINGSNVWLAPLTRKAAYDPVKDLAPVSMLGSTPYILFVHPSLPAKSVKELIAYAKTRPGELNNSVGGIGGSSHLAGELFKSMAGVRIVAVSYSSTSAEIQDLMGGRVQLAITTAPSMLPLVKAGKLRAVAVTSAKPSAVAPDLPTIAASGLPGYEWGQSQAMFVPSKTPAAVIQRLNLEVVRFLGTPEAKERLLSNGTEFVGSSPEQLAAAIKSDTARLSKLIKDSGIRVE